MKTLIITSLALTCLSVASFAQSTAPSKKNDAVSTQAAKNTSKTKATTFSPGKETTATVPSDKKTNEKHTAVTPSGKKTAATSPGATKTGAGNPTGKNSNPYMQQKSNNSQAANAATRHLKEDGTPDKRVKEKEKHG